MNALFGADTLAALGIARYLRRPVINRIESGLRILLIVVAAGAFVAAAVSMLESQLDTSRTIKSLDSSVQELLQSTQARPAPVKKERNYGVISSRNIFGQIVKAPVEAAPAKPKVDTNLSLIGTFVTQGQTPYAIIEDQKKQIQEVFNVGDSVFDAAKLTAIYVDRVEINRDGQTEVLRLDDMTSSGGGSVAGGAESPMVIAEQEVDTALNNLPLLMTQARAVPYFKDGRSIGLRLFAIKPGSIFEKIGLMNGDILKSVNGNDLGDLTQAVKLFEKLKQERALTVVLERRQEEKTLSYQIR